MDNQYLKFDYLKLDKAPVWILQYPLCSACCVELDYNDGWDCPSCGTSWPDRAEDGDEGELYADKCGEDPDGPAVTEDEAWLIANMEEPDRSEYLAKIRQWQAQREAANG